MSNRPPIPAEHRWIWARLADLLEEWARAELAKEKAGPALQPDPPPDNLTVVKPRSL